VVTKESYTLKEIKIEAEISIFYLLVLGPPCGLQPQLSKSEDQGFMLKNPLLPLNKYQ
jgi:hypothetical protein